MLYDNCNEYFVVINTTTNLRAVLLDGLVEGSLLPLLLDPVAVPVLPIEVEIYTVLALN